jgi:hypothetical protein
MNDKDKRILKAALIVYGLWALGAAILCLWVLFSR